MKALKHFLIRYKAWIMAVLAPLGPVKAVALIAFIDASFFGIPIDAAVVYYISADPRRVFLYSVMAAIGSALGSSIPYLIGYLGGETVVEKRLGRKRFARVHAFSEEYGDLALIIPALMPPGFPFKACVLIAGVTEMSFPHFLLAIFAGRLLRFLIVGTLILLYGPQILSFLTSAFQHHRVLALVIAAATVALIVMAVRWLESKHLGRHEAAEKTADHAAQDLSQ